MSAAVTVVVATDCHDDRVV